MPVMAVELVQRTRERERNQVQRRGRAEAFGISREYGEAGNRVVLESEDSFIENQTKGVRVKLKVKGETYVFDIQYSDDELDEFTLESGAGVNGWPECCLQDIPLLPKRSDLRMCVATGTEIQNLGRKIVQFRGVKATTGQSSSSGFTRRM